MSTQGPQPLTGLDRVWPWLSLIPLGLGVWNLVYAGLRARRPLWTAIGAVCCAVIVVGWALSIDAESDTAGFLFIVGWAADIAASFSVRRSFQRRVTSPWWLALQAGEDRREVHEAALELVREDPALAREVGVGRPDTRGAQAGGLVDVNNATVAALEQLPGVDDALATRIVEARAEVRGFSSLEDCGEALDLDGGQVEALRDLVVFLPRR